MGLPCCLTLPHMRSLGLGAAKSGGLSSRQITTAGHPRRRKLQHSCSAGFSAQVPQSVGNEQTPAASEFYPANACLISLSEARVVTRACTTLIPAQNK